ncbi:hypothetical protein L9F63_009933 [Diploptera punctata]|uniref:Trichoplein keratin filament-binding protein n=1 Tax=Diploptera punctata TaxID=6984 RepID=A0AAD8AIG6_DIPPU|nr:hypothetical protein L9F63_009933 [Diploptera punctata]
MTMSSRQNSACSWASRRMRQEEAMVRRRNAEWDRQQLWNGVTQYFHTWDVLNRKHNELSSPHLYKQGMELYKKAVEDQKKLQNLELRRQKLAMLLFEESRQYELELARQKYRPSSHRIPLEELKCKRNREAELKLYYKWRTDQPAVRDMERKQHGHFVREAWVKQVQDRKEEREKEEKEKMEMMQELEKQRLAEEEQKKQELEEKKERALQLQDHLRRQIEELRNKERKADELKKDEAEAMQKRAKLEEILTERRAAEEKLDKKNHFSFLQKQYQLKLRRRAREVQEQLADDMRLIERLLVMEVEEQTHRNEWREAAHQEMIKTRDILARQAIIEKQREREMDFLFHEEAQKLWAEQEERWNLEREARERLLTEVLIELQRQLEEKLESNLAEQRELVKEREEILSRVEQTNAELKEERAELRKKKELLKKEIDVQVADKQLRLITEARIAELEAEKKKEEAKLEEQKLLQELKKMEAAGYNPMGQRRLRVVSMNAFDRKSCSLLRKLHPKTFLHTQKSVHAIIIVEIPKLPGEVTLQRTNREQPDGNRCTLKPCCFVQNVGL